MTHINPYTGLTYAQDPTIMAYETGNELGGPVFGDKDVPVAWTRDICQFVKKLGMIPLPYASILMFREMDGGVG
jgi:mannan endo-1,4-beta-mannosidase